MAVYTQDELGTPTIEEIAEFHAHSGVVAFQTSDAMWRQMRCRQNVTVASTGRVIPIRGGLNTNAIRPIYPGAKDARNTGHGSHRPDPSAGTDAGGEPAGQGGVI